MLSEPLCEECGHRWVYHGDRAVAACDSGYMELGTHRLRKWGEPAEPNALCSCRGWVEPSPRGR